jgi:hypothetical protein
METIKLVRSGNTWFIETDCPETLALFGTPRIPTAFTSATPYAVVLATIIKLNPQANVITGV